MLGFNVIVPSDTNSELYPENTSSSFKVRLNEPIELDQRGNWEVALVDLQVPANLKKLDYLITVESTHIVSRKQTKETSLANFLEDLMPCIIKLNFAMRKGPDFVFDSNIHLKTYNREIVNPPVIVFEFSGRSDNFSIQNVMFLDHSQVQAGHLGEGLPLKLKFNHTASMLLNIPGNILSPWPVVPRFNFDRSMFQPTTNETLFLPLDENYDRLTDCYTNSGYYIYFYQTACMSRPKAVYIPRAVEQGVVGLFQESLKQVLDYSETEDTSKWIHASTVNFSVSSSDPYRSRLDITLAVRKTPAHYTIFRNYNSLLQIYICKELASTLNMANSSVWIYFPQWYEQSVQQKLTFEDRVRLDNDQQFNGIACVPATKKDVFSTVEGKLDSSFPRVGRTEENGDYTHNHYMATFKLRGSEKLYDKENYKINVEVPLKFEFDEQNLVQYLHIHCNELLYDPVLRTVNRPNGGGWG